jgi:Zn finger protein HypA/HybF involved in hydrogenase expression
MGRRLSLEFVKKQFEMDGYKLVSERYINNREKLEYVCPNGHKHHISWDKWNQGRRCPYCYGNAKYTIEFVRKEFAKEGYELLSRTYNINREKLKYKCPNGHKHSMSFDFWCRGVRCPHCLVWGTSRLEKQIKEVIDRLKINYVENDRTILLNPKTNKYLELDIFIPPNKAIECNGIYWHSMRPHNDILKKKLCRDLNIDLLVITDKFWKNNRKECEYKISKFVNSN